MCVPIFSLKIMSEKNIKVEKRVRTFSIACYTIVIPKKRCFLELRIGEIYFRLPARKAYDARSPMLPSWLKGKIILSPFLTPLILSVYVVSIFGPSKCDCCTFHGSTVRRKSQLRPASVEYRCGYWSVVWDRRLPVV